MAKKAKEQTIDIQVIERGIIDVCIVGLTPLIYNAMSNKVKRELLLPAQKKNKTQLASRLKHNPVQEYRDCFYRTGDDNWQTRLIFKADAPKKAMASAAIDLEGAAKAQLGRLMWVYGDLPTRDYFSVWGVPELKMDVVKQAGINGAPDLRTRGILPRWAAKLEVEYTKPILKEKPIVNLLSAAGIIRGIGDFRPEKGAGNYGQFKIVSPNDPQWIEITKLGRVKQDAALDNPTCYDGETEEMLEWFRAEAAERGFKEVA